MRIFSVRNIVAAVAVIGLIGVAFVAGYSLGSERGLASALGLAARINALQHQNLIEQMETGRITEAKDNLNMLLDGDVLEIAGSRAATRDNATMEKSSVILSRIAEFRKRYPYSNPAGSEATKRIQDILSKASHEK